MLRDVSQSATKWKGRAKTKGKKEMPETWLRPFLKEAHPDKDQQIPEDTDYFKYDP